MTSRPTSLNEVASQSDSIEEFGRNLRDWLHEVRRFTSRPQLIDAVAVEPRRLKECFPLGDVADAWLAAYAEHLAANAGFASPEWAFDPSRTCARPWFADVSASPGLRAIALLRSPLAFKRRNIYAADVDLPLRLRSGRPRKNAGQRRKSNAARQARFRKRRAEELANLRKVLP
jgi:hypothetical protein